MNTKQTEALKLALVQRITDYLSGGGLFNPELADHIAVRDLLIDCRKALAPQPAQQQEPVAICCNCLGTKIPQATDPDWKGRCDCEPPQPAQRNPLTDEEIKRRKPISADFVSFRAGVRCMEREYRIGEKR